MNTKKSNPTLRNVVALFVGGFVGGVVILAIESINTLLYPPPNGIDFNDPDALVAYIDTLPIAAFLVVLTAFAAGSFSSAWTATRIRATQRLIVALSLGCFFQVAAIYNFTVMPTPTWMWLAGFTVFLPPAWAGGHLGRRAVREV
jgi:hypothetical protein